MPLGRRRPLARDAAIGAVAYKHGERRAEEAEREAQAAAPPPSQTPPPSESEDSSTTEKINELVQLHASGALTDEEFAAAKAKALGIS
jgi:uncharacterized membrane protein YebE (DUF533 family)